MTAMLVTRVTSRVEHLAVFAYDRDAPDVWSTGRYVPLCGQERHHGQWTWTQSSHGQIATERRRKRICSRCVRLVDQLRRLAAELEPEADDPLPGADEWTETGDV